MYNVPNRILTGALRPWLLSEEEKKTILRQWDLSPLKKTVSVATFEKLVTALQPGYPSVYAGTFNYSAVNAALSPLLQLFVGEEQRYRLTIDDIIVELARRDLCLQWADLTNCLQNATLPEKKLLATGLWREGTRLLVHIDLHWQEAGFGGEDTLSTFRRLYSYLQHFRFAVELAAGTYITDLNPDHLINAISLLKGTKDVRFELCFPLLFHQLQEADWDAGTHFIVLHNVLLRACCNLESDLGLVQSIESRPLWKAALHTVENHCIVPKLAAGLSDFEMVSDKQSGWFSSFDVDAFIFNHSRISTSKYGIATRQRTEIEAILVQSPDTWHAPDLIKYKQFLNKITSDSTKGGTGLQGNIPAEVHLTQSAAAKRYKVDAATLRRWCGNGLIKNYAKGRQVSYKSTEIEQVLASKGIAINV
jgi:hypothetical protein